MWKLYEEALMILAKLFREIIQNNPPLTHLRMMRFSGRRDGNESAGEIILEALLNSSIITIEELNLFQNSSWFENPRTSAEREGTVDMLADIICK